MKPTTICSSCGAELLPEGRFCRSCGQPAKQLDPSSVTEGTTRLLETPEAQAPPFGETFYEHHGSLANVTSRMPPQANPTNRNLELNRKPTNWVLAGAVMFAILALMTLMVIIKLRKRTVPAPPTPPVVTRPAIPVVPPAIPPPPAPPHGIPQGGTIGREFIYPGAETTMEINGDADGNVLQLHTSDPFDKVVGWYTEKLKPRNTVKMKDSNVILEGNELTAIINAAADGTTIMLTQGGDD
jgi:hypothetical protein